MDAISLSQRREDRINAAFQCYATRIDDEIVSGRVFEIAVEVAFNKRRTACFTEGSNVHAEARGAA